MSQRTLRTDIAQSPGSLPVDAGLALPRLSIAHRILPLLRASLRTPELPARESDAASWWPAALHGLPAVALWRGAPPERQRAVLSRLNRSILEEAWWIEKVGIAFAAKMVLLARTTDERMLYALFAADEARHLAAFSNWVNPEGSGSAFHAVLARLIDEGDRSTLTFVVQVVLEGWGLAWYRTLADACEDPSLAGVFAAILAEEARHHGSGVVLAAEHPPGAAAVEILLPFLAMVAVGPQSTLTALDAELGPLSRPMRLQVLEELGGVTHAAPRLSLLRRLMEKAPAQGVIDTLDAAGAFEPLPPEACT